MRTRTIDPSLDQYKEEIFEKITSSQDQWHKLECKLITPLYGGGVESSTIDEKMPIRGAEIRGQLRFWWRLLAKQLWMKDQSDKEIQKAEFKLWGGGTSEQFASKVFIKVSNLTKIEMASYKEYAPQYSTLGYVFFPADNETDSSVSHDLLKEDFTWTLSIKFDVSLSDEDKDQAIQTIRWWSQFGGLGARSRRGTGAFIVEAADELLNPVLSSITKEEAKSANCILSLKNSQPEASKAWNTSIEKLKNFRQAPNMGRNPGQQANRPGRSRWPEPDAIRRIQDKWDPDHKPRHEAGDIFPRGMFGMPVIFDFGRNNHKEPNTTTLQPIGKERMSSPLLLRPYYDRATQKYAPMALLLPYQHLLSKEVDLKGSRANSVKLWESGKEDLIQPIKDNGGTNPLEAFMNYFQKG